MFWELFCSLLYASLNLYNPLWTPLGQVIRLLPMRGEPQIGTGTRHTSLT